MAYSNPPNRHGAPNCNSDFGSLAWIAPNGQVYGLEGTNHTSFAFEVLETDRQQQIQDVGNELLRNDPRNMLMYHGWVRAVNMANWSWAQSVEDVYRHPAKLAAATLFASCYSKVFAFRGPDDNEIKIRYEIIDFDGASRLSRLVKPAEFAYILAGREGEKELFRAFNLREAFLKKSVRKYLSLLLEG